LENNSSDEDAESFVKNDDIIIPVVEHGRGAEIAEARGALTCMKEH